MTALFVILLGAQAWGQQAEESGGQQGTHEVLEQVVVEQVESMDGQPHLLVNGFPAHDEASFWVQTRERPEDSSKEMLCPLLSLEDATRLEVKNLVCKENGFGWSTPPSKLVASLTHLLEEPVLGSWFAPGHSLTWSVVGARITPGDLGLRLRQDAQDAEADRVGATDDLVVDGGHEDKPGVGRQRQIALVADERRRWLERGLPTPDATFLGDVSRALYERAVFGRVDLSSALATVRMVGRIGTVEGASELLFHPVTTSELAWLEDEHKASSTDAVKEAP